MSIIHLSNEIPYYDDYFLPDSEGGSQNKMAAPEYGDAEAVEKLVKLHIYCVTSLTHHDEKIIIM